jgi:hypothetical protein
MTTVVRTENFFQENRKLTIMATLFYQKVNSPLAPRKRGVVPTGPLVRASGPHHPQEYGGAGVTSFYAFKKSMSQKPAFRRTRNHLNTTMREVFPRLSPLKPRHEKSLGGVSQGW